MRPTGTRLIRAGSVPGVFGSSQAGIARATAGQDGLNPRPPSPSKAYDNVLYHTLYLG
jgi:hypothetical protein